MFSPTITSFAKASANAAAKMNANAKLKAFHEIARSRVSARRFEPNVAVPDDVWRDVLQMTLVSTFTIVLASIGRKMVHAILVQMPTSLQTTLVTTPIIHLQKCNVNILHT